MLPEPVRRVPLLRAATTGRLLPEPELPVREQRRALRPGPTEPLPELLRGRPLQEQAQPALLLDQFWPKCRAR